MTSETAEEVLEYVLLLNYDDRLIIAGTLLQKLEDFVEGLPPTDPVRERIEVRLFGELKQEMDMLRLRARECREAADDMSSVSEDEESSYCYFSLFFSPLKIYRKFHHIIYLLYVAAMSRRS